MTVHFVSGVFGKNRRDARLATDILFYTDR